MLGLNYGPETNPLFDLADRGAANLSVYARHRDYHDVLKGKLKELAQWLKSRAIREGIDAAAEVKVFVDRKSVV